MLREIPSEPMLASHSLLLASLSAAGVTLLGHWLMSRADRKRRRRRAFAESIHQCCEELEEAAIRYWTSVDSGEESLVAAAKIKVTLMKMIRFIRNDSPVIRRAIKEKERQQLENGWIEIQKTTEGEFETQTRHSNLEKMVLVMGKVTTIRAKIAGMRVE